MISSATSNKVAAVKTKHVLYVDDMRELREVARLALTRVGHTVALAPDGSDAFELVKADPRAFNIVITDHHMATMNGLELVIKLREIQFAGMIAVVSSELNSDTEVEYRKLGIDSILYKPVAISDLRALVLAS
jgi:DNA-binding response OmpR family regulator